MIEQTKKEIPSPKVEQKSPKDAEAMEIEMKKILQVPKQEMELIKKNWDNIRSQEARKQKLSELLGEQASQPIKASMVTPPQVGAKRPSDFHFDAPASKKQRLSESDGKERGNDELSKLIKKMN